jgi:predicted fused transcriptional regulator/phosphomethylpyrimidine kinase
MSKPTTDVAGIRQTIRALRAAGWELWVVNDREEEIDVKTEMQAVSAITDVDDAFLYVRNATDKAYVYFVLGNDPEEVICDYTTNLSGVIDPLLDKWDEG